MASFNILMVDDNPAMIEILDIYLKEAGYHTYKAGDGIEALEVLKNHTIHLILMDIMMPRLDGIKATLQIRQDNNIPIILLSAKTQERDKIEGLGIGADDYITKPFRPLEVVARIKAHLRRYTELNRNIAAYHIINIRGLTIYLKKKAVEVNGIPIKLTPTEYKILCLLAKHKGEVMSVEAIYEAVWEQAFLGAESTVMFHISKLREKIEENPKDPMYLKVVWGRGYLIE